LTISLGQSEHHSYSGVGTLRELLALMTQYVELVGVTTILFIAISAFQWKYQSAMITV